MIMWPSDGYIFPGIDFWISGIKFWNPVFDVYSIFQVTFWEIFTIPLVGTFSHSLWSSSFALNGILASSANCEKKISTVYTLIKAQRIMNVLDY